MVQPPTGCQKCWQRITFASPSPSIWLYALAQIHNHLVRELIVVLLQVACLKARTPRVNDINSKKCHFWILVFFFLINKQTHCNPRLKFGQRDSGHPGLPPITGTREAHMALDTKPSNQLDESRDIHVPLEFWCLPCQDIQASPGTWKTKQLGVQLHRDKLPPLAKGPLQHLQLPLGDVLPQQGVRQVACLLLLEVALVRLHHWVTGLPLIAHGRIADAWASCQKQILIQSIEWRNGETQ